MYSRTTSIILIIVSIIIVSCQKPRYECECTSNDNSSFREIFDETGEISEAEEQCVEIQNDTVGYNCKVVETYK